MRIVTLTPQILLPAMTAPAADRTKGAPDLSESAGWRSTELQIPILGFEHRSAVALC